MNLELVKKPPRRLEYVLVHEMVHLLEPRHGERFVRLMDEHLPHWRHLRDELNAAPLVHESWEY
jgi:predicted metal-dependent hydrolase